MRKQKLGKDLEVSAVGLGCMGMTYAYGKPANKEEMKKLAELEKGERASKLDDK